MRLVVVVVVVVGGWVGGWVGGEHSGCSSFHGLDPRLSPCCAAASSHIPHRNYLPALNPLQQDKKVLAPNVMRFIGRFNEVSMGKNISSKCAHSQASYPECPRLFTYCQCLQPAHCLLGALC